MATIGIDRDALALDKSGLGEANLYGSEPRGKSLRRTIGQKSDDRLGGLLLRARREGPCNG